MQAHTTTQWFAHVNVGWEQKGNYRLDWGILIQTGSEEKLTQALKKKPIADGFLPFVRNQISLY